MPRGIPSTSTPEPLDAGGSPAEPSDAEPASAEHVVHRPSAPGPAALGPTGRPPAGDAETSAPDPGAADRPSVQQARPDPDTPAGVPSAAEYGVGARVALHPMSDRFVDIVLGALDDVTDSAAARRMTVETSDVSTFVGGDEADVLTWIRDLVTAAAGRADGVHLGVSVLLSRGCPGEVRCTLPAGRAWAPQPTLDLVPTGVPVSAEWSLYPLDDTGARAHMDPIERAIDQARASGLYAGSPHYATRLVGDAAAVLSLVGNTWIDVGRQVQHVVTHLQMSINSPTQA